MTTYRNDRLYVAQLAALKRTYQARGLGCILWLMPLARSFAPARVFHVILGMVENEEGKMTYERVAESVLEPMRLQNGGVLSLPVDPVAVARHYGINVYSWVC